MKLTKKQLEEAVDIALYAYSWPQDFDLGICIAEGKVYDEERYPQYGQKLNAHAEYILIVRRQDTWGYCSEVREGLTKEQIDYCEEKGWLSIHPTDSDNPQEWREYSSYDDLALREELTSAIKKYTLALT